MSINANIITQGGVTFICALIDGELKSVASGHPNFAPIFDALKAGDDNVGHLFNVAEGFVASFEDGPLSARVSVEDEQILLDGEPIHNSLTEQILDFLNDGNGDYKPLVRFIEKIEANPNEHSREQLYDWMSSAQTVDGALTIAPDGDIIGYKGVNDDLTSVHAGPAIVDGERVTGHVPNALGSVIEMARENVNHDPTQGCSTGLHIGTWGYASGWGSTTLKVKFNPSDVVSVPTDCAAQKVRVCRYEVVEVLTAKLGTSIDYSGADDVDGDPGDEGLWV